MALVDIQVKKSKNDFLGVCEPQRILFKDSAEEYLEYSRAKKVKRSHERDVLTLEAHLLDLWGDQHFTGIPPKLIENYKAQRLSACSREATDHLQKNVLKGTRWLLLKNPQNLRDDLNERARLKEALAINKPLATAYYMKEDLRLLWSMPDKAAAEADLREWIARAETSGIWMLKEFATTLQVHMKRILAYYDHRISTGPLEGTNNKIKTLQLQAYGFRDKDFFMPRIYALHSTRYELLGWSTRTWGTHLRDEPEIGLNQSGVTGPI